MRVPRSVKVLSVLAAAFTLVLTGAAPAFAQNGFFYVGNAAGGCLDYSPNLNYRVFNQCHGTAPYQWLKFTNAFNYGPDAYTITFPNGTGFPSTCLEAFGNGARARGALCAGRTTQVWIVRYANNQPYFDSVGYASQHLCLTKSAFYDGHDGYLLTTEPCAGRLSQFWQWLDFRPS